MSRGRRIKTDGRGRRPIARFVSADLHINEMATTATNAGAYTVESLAPGLCYFIEDDTFILAASSGYMKVHLSTAKVIASELSGIIEDYEQDRRNGVVPMRTRDIQRMLEE